MQIFKLWLMMADIAGVHTRHVHWEVLIPRIRKEQNQLVVQGNT